MINDISAVITQSESCSPNAQFQSLCKETEISERYGAEISLSVVFN